jgi:hypothetical protein
MGCIDAEEVFGFPSRMSSPVQQSMLVRTNANSSLSSSLRVYVTHGGHVHTKLDLRVSGGGDGGGIG